MRLGSFKKQNLSYPGEGDTPSSGPHPPAVSALWALAAETQAQGLGSGLAYSEKYEFPIGGGEWLNCKIYTPKTQ